MEIIEKIEYLNSICDKSLCITKYSIGWDFDSYQAESALRNVTIQDKDFEHGLDRAIVEAERHGRSKL